MWKEIRRGIAILLSLVVIGNILQIPTTTIRADDNSNINIASGSALTLGTIGEENNTPNNSFVEYLELGEVETSAIPMGVFSLSDGTVDLVNGTKTNWIDRLDLSGEAKVIRDLYDILVEASDNDGIDDYLIEDSNFSGYNTIPIASVDLDGTLTEEEASAKTQEVVNNYFKYMRAAYDAFDRDHPEVFWLNGSMQLDSQMTSHSTQSGTSWNITIWFVLKSNEGFDIRAEGYNETTIKKGITTVDSKVAELVKTNDFEEKTTEEKIKYLNNYLTISNEYNTSQNLSDIPHNSRECISALVGSEGANGPVCEAYARAFKVLCDKAGIPCVLVDGYAKTSLDSYGEAHMWNYVQVDNTWLAVDITWNDPVVNGSSGIVSGAEKEDWLFVYANDEINGMPFIDSHPVANQASSTGVAFTNGPELATFLLNTLEGLNTFEVPVDNLEVTIPILYEYKYKYQYNKLHRIPITIQVDGNEATKDENGKYIVILGNAEILLYFNSNDQLTMEVSDGGSIPTGTYEISMTVPANYMTSKQVKELEIILTVSNQKYSKIIYSGKQLELVKTYNGDSYFYSADSLDGNVSIVNANDFSDILVDNPVFDKDYQFVYKEVEEDIIVEVLLEAPTNVGTYEVYLAVIPEDSKDGFTGWQTSETEEKIGTIVIHPVTTTMECSNVTLNYTMKEDFVIASGSASLKVSGEDVIPEGIVEVIVNGETKGSGTLSNGEAIVAFSDITSLTSITFEYIPSNSSYKEVQAEFNALRSVSVVSNGSTTYTVNGVTEENLIFAEGQEITVKAGTREGYTFDCWNVNGITVEDTTKETITFTMPNSDVRIEACWKSNNTSLKSVTVFDVEGIIQDTTISITLPYTASMPSMEDIVINNEESVATVTDLKTLDSGETWTFTVVAEDGITKQDYVIYISIQERSMYTVTYTDGKDGIEVFPDQVSNVYVDDTTPVFNGNYVHSEFEFLGWDKEVSSIVTGDVIYTAVWGEHKWSFTWKNDSTHHWHECENENCSIKENSMKQGYTMHQGGTATCNLQAVCEACGTPYGELNSTNHVGETEIRDAKEATQVAPGYTGDTYCKACNTKIKSGSEIPKLTPTPTATSTPKPTATSTPKPTATSTPKPTATNIPKPTATNTPKPTATSTPKPTATSTPKPTATSTPKPTATNTPKPTATSTPKPTATSTPKPTATSTPKPTATSTPTPTATSTPKPTATSTPKPTATSTPKPTATSTPKPTATSTPKPTATSTPKPTATSTPTPTATSTPKPTATSTPKPTATNTPKPTATSTPKPTATSTPKPTATSTPKPTATSTPKPTATSTPKPTATSTPKPTATNTPTPTATSTPKPTATNTPKPTATSTPKPTATSTPKPTATSTPKPTATSMMTPVPTKAVIKPIVKPISTATPTPTPTSMPKPVVIQKPIVKPMLTTTPTPIPTYNPQTSWVSEQVYEEEKEQYNIFLGTSGDNIFMGNTMQVGQSIDLNFYGVKNWAKDKYTYKWTSSDESIATVNRAGVVTMHSAGIAIISLELINKQTGDVLKVAPVEVGVPQAEYNVFIRPSKNDSDLRKKLSVGNQMDLNFYGVENYKKEDYEYEWISSDTTIATVDSKGMVTAVSSGKVVIRLKLFNKKTKEYLTVSPMVIYIPEKKK